LLRDDSYLKKDMVIFRQDGGGLEEDTKAAFPLPKSLFPPDD
jgi:hypothetical protein